MSVVNSILALFLGDKSKRVMKEVQPYLERIKAAYPEISKLSNDGLRQHTQELKRRIYDSYAEQQARIDALKQSIEHENPEVDEREKMYEEIDRLEKEITDLIEKTLDEILPEAFSIVKETARRFKENSSVEVTASEFDRDLAARADFVEIDGDKARFANSWLAGGTEITWDMVHYDVQLIGGVVLHQGKIAEMATGEGKTLVATLPIFLNALTGRGVHVVTVNDYLAKRDSEWMGPIYMFHGLSVDCIDKHQPNSPERRKAYQADITFGTNNEFGFDYLRDNMAVSPDDLVQRMHNYAIVDEVDSVLIDDARTPLIISGPVPKGDDQLFVELRPKVEKLVEKQRAMTSKYLSTARQKMASSNTKEQEEGALELLRSFKGMPKSKPLIKFLSEPGIKAAMIKTENFYMQENNKNMHIVTDPLLFIIDEKTNSVEMTDKGIDMITDSTEDNQFFVLPDIAAELSSLENGSLSEEEKAQAKDEMMQNYAIKSERVHTINQLLKAYVMFEKDVEYVLMDNKVKIVDEQTGRIMDGRRYSDGLHQAIEAKENVKVEAATQTYATITLQNYFRMYEKLAGMTGTAETEAGELWNIYKLDVVVIPTNRPISRIDEEDLIYKTKREKFNAVIQEIEKLVSENRPVLVGTTSVETSELLSKMLTMRKIKHNVLNAKLHKREADIVAEAGRAGTVTIATNMAGRGTDIKLAKEVKEAGGLAIIGTERHESRRVDRQLRGRAGRQGDVGSSQFYVSLEDNLMRIFGSDRISKMMDRLGLKEGEVIQHSMITKSIERAQRKVEENNFGIRKRLLEYDDVMNSQREVIYKRRRHALYGDRLQLDIENMFRDVAENIVEGNHPAKDYENFKLEIFQYLGMNSPISKEDFDSQKPETVKETVYRAARKRYKERIDTIAETAVPIIKNVHETQTQFENIAVPFSDGKKAMQVVVNIEKALESEGVELARGLEKSVTLAIIDNEWKEHLREMDDLRQSVQNARFEQKDPLLIYKFESFGLFKKMMDRVSYEVVSFLAKAALPGRTDQVQTTSRTTLAADDSSKLQTSRPGSEPEQISRGGVAPPPPRKVEPVRVEKKIGRNDPCPCGSGKKYKQCHGKAVNQSV